MQIPKGPAGDIFVLIPIRGPDGVVEPIEFDGNGPDAAFVLVRRHCPGRKAELLRNGRSPGSLHRAEAGFWIISPPVSPKSPR